MIGFLHPWALVGLAAAAIPVLLHLLARREPPTVVFPAVRYLITTTREHQRRLKLQHLLLLLLRTLLIVALVLAAAGPTLPLSGVRRACAQRAGAGGGQLAEQRGGGERAPRDWRSSRRRRDGCSPARRRTTRSGCSRRTACRAEGTDRRCSTRWRRCRCPPADSISGPRSAWPGRCSPPSRVRARSRCSPTSRPPPFPRPSSACRSSWVGRTIRRPPTSGSAGSRPARSPGAPTAGGSRCRWSVTRVAALP